MSETGRARVDDGLGRALNQLEALSVQGIRLAKRALRDLERALGDRESEGES